MEIIHEKQRELQELNNKIMKLKESLSYLEKEKDSQTIYLKNLKADIQKTEEKRVNFEERFKTAKEYIESKSKELENKEKIFNTRLDEAEKYLKDTEESLKTLYETKEKDLIEKLDEKQRELDKEITRYVDKKNSIDSEIASLKETIKERLSEREEWLPEEFEALRADFEEEYLQRRRLLEEEYSIKELSLEEEHNDNLSKINQERSQLIQEYEQKKDSIDDVYREKETILEAKYEEKNSLLEKDYEEKENALKEKEQTLIDEYEKKKLELDNDYNDKINSLAGDIEQKRIDCDKYVEEETKKIEEARKSFKEEKETLIKKIDDEMMDRETAFVDELMFLHSDYQNFLDKKEWDLEKREKEFNRKAKEREAGLLKANEDFRQKVEEFNKEVDDFNNSKTLYLKEHHFLHLTKRKVKEHMFFYLVVLICLFFVSCIYAYSNEYRLFKNTFIASSITRYLNSKTTISEYTFSLNTKNSVLAKFTQLDGLSIDVDTSKNGTFSEDYEKVILNSADENFVFERFYKNKNLIMKTYDFGQYIIFDDMDEAGYEYEEDGFNKSVLEALKRSLSKNKNNNYTDVSKINVNGSNNLLDFLNNSFLLNKNYEFFYTIENQDDVLFKEIFTNIFESKNYSNFMLEESEVANKLGHKNEFEDIEDIMKGILENSKVKSNVINLKISPDSKLSDIDMTFYLEYKDSTMASSVLLTIKVRCSLESIDEDITLEKAQFRMNSVKVENLIDVNN